MVRALLLLILPIVLCFCSSKNTEEIQEVNALQQKLYALEFSFNTIDTIAVDDAIKDYRKNLALIKKYYNDTVDKDFVQLMNKYKGIKKAGRNLSKKDRKDISTNIKITKHQLHNLLIEIESGAMPKDSISYFVNAEGDKINKINKDVTSYVLTCNEVILLDTTLSRKVQDLLNNKND